MRRLYYVGLSTYFGLRALDLIVGTSLVIIAPQLLLALFSATAVLGIVVAFTNAPRWANVLYAFMVVTSFAVAGFSIMAVGGWSATLRGLSVLVLAPLFATSFPQFWEDQKSVKLVERYKASKSP